MTDFRKPTRQNETLQNFGSSLQTARKSVRVMAAVMLLAPLPFAQGDWPMWGHDETRNMTSEETGLPGTFAAGEFVGVSDEIDLSTAINVKWLVKLGSQSYGNATVSNGRVYVGTNNDSPRDPRFKGDRCTVYCLDEATGDFIWQLNVPKLGTGKVSDWEYLGMCSSPSVEGDRVYLVTNRCEVICLDVNGLADGNDGPYQDEAQYQAGPGKEPIALAGTDADIIWMLNMIDECGVFPHNITTSSVLIAGDNLWVTTSNGVDYGHVETPAPNAPSLIMVDKVSGKLIAEEDSGLSSRIFHSNWSSPAYLRTPDTELCIFGGPDGVLYAFSPKTSMSEKGWAVFEEAWQYDCNPPEYRMKDGVPITYTKRLGPSEILGTPSTDGGRVYAVIGQDPEHGEGIGNLTCMDAKGKELWSYRKINRSMSSLAIADGMVFAADYSGFIYCLDADTGQEHWIHDTKGHIWASPLVADGKLYLGNEDGFMTIVPASKTYDEKDVVEVDMISPIYSSAIAANGVVYVATHTHLFALAKDGEPKQGEASPGSPQKEN
ncbi:MAG: outer membrane protein assembly factor BamB [Candidatus Paceibacteria bacterium]|jgi:outer membrane protein assembly factor BamB